MIAATCAVVSVAIGHWIIYGRTEQTMNLTFTAVVFCVGTIVLEIIKQETKDMWLVCCEPSEYRVNRGKVFASWDDAVKHAEWFASNYPGREYFIFKNTHVVKFEGVTVTEVGED